MAPTSASCSGTRTATRPRPGTGRLRLERGRSVRSCGGARRRRGRRHDRRAFWPRRRSGAGATPARSRASPFRTCRRSSSAWRRSSRRGGRCGLWRCDLRIRARRAVRAAGRARRPFRADRGWPRGKAGAQGREVSRPPRDDDRLSGIYGTVLYEELGPLHQRNVAIFADGEVDRSPTGSATSARTAVLVADGLLAERQTWRNDSIVGTTFHARAIGQAPDGLLTEVEGMAFRTWRTPLLPGSARPAWDRLRPALKGAATLPG